MVRIIADTSTLYSSKQAREAGFAVSPLSVTIGGKSYREFDEISSDEFIQQIQQGHMPTSSQPAVGEVVALYDEFSQDEILNITMALGLSGTYTSAVAAKDLCQNPEQVTVINSKTLCGPHRYLVEHAVQMAAQGKTLREIVQRTEELIESAKSFLIPADFGYLRRGGRLSPMVAYVGQAIHLVPIMTQSEDSRQLVVAGVRRSFSQAIQHIMKALQRRGVGAGWRIYISHAGVPQKAEQARELLRPVFPQAVFDILPLSPAFITQGGPGCVAVQVIRA